MKALFPPWRVTLLAVVILVAVGALASAQAAAQAWLVAFVFVSGFPLGALTLLMIGRLTGGRWVAAFDPELRRLAGWTPWLFLLIAPLLLAPAFAFRWAADPAGTPEGLKLYLSPLLFAVRSLVALVVWSGLGRMFAAGRPGPVAAGVGLVLHGLLLLIIPNDWMLSNRPGWTTSNLAMIAAAGQILSAAAPGPDPDPGPAGAGLGGPRRLRRGHAAGARLPRLHGLPGGLVRRPARQATASFWRGEPSPGPMRPPSPRSSGSPRSP